MVKFSLVKYENPEISINDPKLHLDQVNPPKFDYVNLSNKWKIKCKGIVHNVL